MAKDVKKPAVPTVEKPSITTVDEPKMLKAKGHPRTEYQKQVERIRRIVTRAEKRGYRFSQDVSTKELRKKSLEELKTYTPEKVYGKGEAISETGKVVSGKQARKEERKRSAKKSAETRKRNFEKKRKQKDKEDYEKARKASSSDGASTEALQWLNQAEIEYQNLLDTLETALQGKHASVAKYVFDAVKDEEATYGREALVRSIAQNPAVIEKLQNCMQFYDARQDGFDEAFYSFMNALTGTIPTKQELERYDLITTSADTI